MTYVEVMSVEDLSAGEMKGVEALGKQILLINLAGKYYAMDDICTHMTCNLSRGRIKGDTVVCPCHFSVFDIKTGTVLGGPAGAPEPVFKVRIEKESVLVDI